MLLHCVVVMAVRNIGSGAYCQSKEAIVNRAPGARLDVSSVDSVRKFASDYKSAAWSMTSQGINGEPDINPSISCAYLEM